MSVRGLWATFIILSVTGAICAAAFCGRARPTLAMGSLANRQLVRRKGIQFAETRGIMNGPLRTSIWFGPDEKGQAYMELEQGGREGLQRRIDADQVQPFMWTVRVFQENNPSDILVFYSPLGTLRGFQERISAPVPGPGLRLAEARHIAEVEAERTWRINIGSYRFLKDTPQPDPSEKAILTFTYASQQHPNGVPEMLRLSVAGNRVTGVYRTLLLPKSFLYQYKTRAAWRETLFVLGGLGLLLLYGAGGTLLALLVIPGERRWPWKAPAVGGTFIGALHLVDRMNGLPAAWMTYPTSSSAHSFLAVWTVKTLCGALGWALVAFATLMLAGGLTREAFPNHATLREFWTSKGKPGMDGARQVLGGYLGAGALLGYVAVFYLLAFDHFHWWVPARLSCAPNVSDSLWPPLQPLAMALRAGVWEECLFRAVPLAGAVILGNRIGRRRIWVGAALILQAGIFGACHADYITLPAYARMAELFIPSLVYGLVYLRWGLLPIITTHAVFDAVVMSLPVFGPGGEPGLGARTVFIAALILPVVAAAARLMRLPLQGAHQGCSRVAL